MKPTTKCILILHYSLIQLFLQNMVLANYDEYVNRTGQTRRQLLNTGDYLPVSIFGSAKKDSRETMNIEYYIPVDTRRQGEGRSFKGYASWPKTFNDNLEKLPKSKFKQLLVKFRLYTRRSKPEGEEISDKNLKTIQSSTWNSTAKVKILIHGYKQRGSNAKMPQALKDAYLLIESEDNIVIVDWGLLARELNYFESAMYFYIVGQRLGEFILVLKNKGFTSSYLNFHLIGFCLGAHAAGVAGQYVRDHSGGGARVWRITGLDPAGPGFHETRTELRLDINDAEFVDCIHTNEGYDFRMGQLGIKRACGRLDFYPNGGVAQTVCGNVHAIGDLILKCDHKKAVDYYTRSIKAEKFKGCKCESYGKFRNGGCDCLYAAFMGEYVEPSTIGVFFLQVFEFSLFEIFEQIGAIGPD